MEHLLFCSKCSIFHNIVKYMIFQRRQKGLLVRVNQKLFYSHDLAICSSPEDSIMSSIAAVIGIITALVTSILKIEQSPVAVVCLVCLDHDGLHPSQHFCSHVVTFSWGEPILSRG